MWRVLLTNLVDPEPLISSTDQTRQMPLNILDIIKLRRKRVVDIDNDDFPIRLAFIEQGHDAEDLDLLDLTHIPELFADFTNIQGIIVAVGFRLCVDLCWIFPCLPIKRTCVRQFKHQCRDRFSSGIPQKGKVVMGLGGDLLEGMHHSSKYTHDEGSNCGRIEVYRA
jgi:hypothetical protein